jgi:signal transduction histidine kinase
MSSGDLAGRARAGSVTKLSGGAPWPRGGARRALLAGIGLPLALAAFIDVATEFSDRPSWRLLIFFTVAGIALAAVLRIGSHVRTLAASAVALSLVGTVLFIADGGDNLGLVEIGALLLLLIDRWRMADRMADGALIVATIMALLALPVRNATGDSPFDVTSIIEWGVLMLAVVALAVAVAVVLRGQDTQRTVAIAMVRRAERAEIARELHDVVAHHVTGMVVATQAARVVTAAGAPPPVDAALVAIEDSGLQALGAMRRLVGVLRTDVDGPGERPRSPAPRLSDLDELVCRFRETAAIDDVEFDVLLDDRVRLDPDLQATAYRVVQESLTNVTRHAFGAARVWIAVTVTAGGVLEIEVTNLAGQPSPAGAGIQGAATDYLGGGGFGLIGMRERVQALGGYLIAGPRAGGGWSVYATVPLAAPHTLDMPAFAEPRPDGGNP